MTNVLLVDDHDLMREGMRLIINRFPSINVVGELSDGSKLEKYNLSNVDLILMDIKMSKMNGIDATKLAKRRKPSIKVIALSMHEEDSFIHRMLKAGANGYVLKNSPKKEVKQAIQNVMKGELHLSKQISEKVLSSFHEIIKGKVDSTRLFAVDKITMREREVIKLVTQQMSNEMISDKLKLSKRTVEAHRRNIMKKIGVKNTAGIVTFALEHDLC